MPVRLRLLAAYEKDTHPRAVEHRAWLVERLEKLKGGGA
jgi:hypothetical protein